MNSLLGPASHGFLPESSSYAAQVDLLSLLLIVLSAAVALLVFGLLAFCCIRYRKGSSVVRSTKKIDSLPIEITWMVVPFLIFLGLFVVSGQEYAYIYTPPSDGIRVYVVGKQWMWKIQHENGQREINELHVPIDQNIIITLSSEDVIHSFFVPAFRVKHDAVPGRYATFWFKAIRAGTYPIFCSQYCGMNHSQMIGEVVAMEPTDYARWEAQGNTPLGMVQLGSSLFHQVGCSGCHAVGATIHAPLLEGIFGKSVPLQDGTFVKCDEQYLRDSILLPNKQIAAGFAPIMPTYQGQLSEEQVNELVAYLESLKSPDHITQPNTP